MKFILVSAVFLTCNLYFSQSTVLHNLHHSTLTSNALNKIGVTDLDNNDYEGSPFLDKNFLPSKIEGEEGVHLLRYNIYNDEIILKRDDDYFKIPKTNLEYFHINDKHVVRLVNGTYYIQTSNVKNNFVILKKENIKFTQGKISENGYSQSTSSKFSHLKTDYFLYNIEDKNLIPAKKEDLLKVFPNKMPEINQIFKKNKFKNEKDYNDLLIIIIN